MRISSRGAFAAAAVLFCPVVGCSLSGCGLGAAVSAVSAVTNITTNGAGFNSPVISKSTPVPVVSASSSGASSPTHAVGGTGTATTAPTQHPIGVLEGASQQSAISALSAGTLKRVDAVLKVTTTGPAQIGVVISTESKITDAQFWQIATAGSAVVPGQTGPPAIGASVNTTQGGQFIFANTDPHDPVYSYVSSLVAAANLGAPGTDNESAFIQRFTDLLDSGQPVYIYAGVASQLNQAQASVDSLVITGRETPNL